MRTLFTFLDGSPLEGARDGPHVVGRGLGILALVIASVLSRGAPAVAREDAVPAKSLTTAEVAELLEREDWVLVDARPTDAYNGWALDGVLRGGHLPGAVDFPARWLDVAHEDREARLRSALEAKGLRSDRNIVVYSTKASERRRVLSFLHESGFRRLHAFDVRAWANDPERALERYAKSHLLVPPSIVQQVLATGSAPSFERAKRILLVEVSWGDEEASYSKGHVPRSFHVNTDHFEPPPSWKLGSPEVLGQFASRYGFRCDDTVILSGEDPTASYRLAIVLRYMGVADVRVLNGGLAAWKAAGYPIETGRTEAPGETAPAGSFGVSIPARPELIDGIERVRKGLRRPASFQLVDNRTWAEFIGETSGYKYHEPKGRIPGSIHGQAGFRGENSLTPYRNIDATMRNADEILALWKASGVDTDRHLSLMCGGGWRAAEVLTFAHVLGLENTSLYSDGWIGWSLDPSHPTETGPPSE